MDTGCNKENIPKKKRVRAANFSNDEKLAIFNLVEKYKEVLENKKTDAVTNRDKNEVWEILAAEFNSRYSSQHRTSLSIKKFYDNKKKELRQNIGERRKSLFKTGGGPADKTPEDNAEAILINILNKKTIYGIDCDVGGDTTVQINNIDYMLEEEDNLRENPKDDLGMYQPGPSTPVTSTKKTKLNVLSTKNKRGNAQSPTPLSDDDEAEFVGMNDKKRRRSAIKGTTDLGKKYEILLDKKMELVDLELIKARKNLQIQDEQAELEKEKLTLEIAIKKAKLANLQENK